MKWTLLFADVTVGVNLLDPQTTSVDAWLFEFSPRVQRCRLKKRLDIGVSKFFYLDCIHSDDLLEANYFQKNLLASLLIFQ